MSKGSLPPPDSTKLSALIAGRGWSWAEKAIYRHLYQHGRGDGLTIADLWELVQPERQERLALGKKAGEGRHFDRRLRKLDDVFEVERVGGGEQTRYRLVGPLARPKVAEATVSKVDKAWALRHQRCAQCGKTPNEDGIKLHVDHKIPRDWGGTNDRENLQALCAECNEGKKNLYATLDEYGNAIRDAMQLEWAQIRIGEFLKAMYPDWVRSDILEMVASPPNDPQDDWMRRRRELRDLGWDYEVKKRREDGRWRTYYRLTKSAPWPTSDQMRKAIAKRPKRLSA